MKCPICNNELIEIHEDWGWSFFCPQVSCTLPYGLDGQEISRLDAALASARAEGYAAAIEQAANKHTALVNLFHACQRLTVEDMDKIEAEINAAALALAPDREAGAK